MDTPLDGMSVKLHIKLFFTAISTSFPDIMMKLTQEKGSGIGRSSLIIKGEL
jgi:hypothetical protein